MRHGRLPSRRLRTTALPVVTWLVVTFAVTAGVAPANVPSHINGLIAFQRNDDASGQIWVVDPTAASPEASAVQVTTGPEPEARPTYGPTKGRDVPEWKLAFQRFTAGSWEIWNRTTRGTAGEQPQFDPAASLVSGPGDQTEPAYSRLMPDEPLLAYISDQTGRREIWLQDATGTRTQLTTDAAGYANPDFAGKPRFVDRDGDGAIDGQRIGLAFESTRGGQRAIWAFDVELDLDGRFAAVRDVRPVATGPEDLFEPSWQTVNDRDFETEIVRSRVNNVLFATAQVGTTYLDYVEEPWSPTAGGTVTPAVPFADPSAISRFALTGDPGGDGGPVWAPNGQLVAFSRTTAANSDIWVVLADGTQPRPLTSGSAPERHPSWQPGSESSVDKVGGHTHPGPVSRRGPGGGGPQTTSGGSTGAGPGASTAPRPRSAVRRSPRLKIGRVRWRGHKVRVSGRAARLAGRIRVTFSCGRRASQRTTRRVASTRGRFRLTLRVRRSCRRVRRGTVVMTYRGDSRHTSGRVSRRVRRR